MSDNRVTKAARCQSPNREVASLFPVPWGFLLCRRGRTSTSRNGQRENHAMMRKKDRLGAAPIRFTPHELTRSLPRSQRPSQPVPISFASTPPTTATDHDADNDERGDDDLTPGREAGGR